MNSDRSQTEVSLKILKASLSADEHEKAFSYHPRGKGDFCKVIFPVLDIQSKKESRLGKKMCYRYRKCHLSSSIKYMKPFQLLKSAKYLSCLRIIEEKKNPGDLKMICHTIRKLQKVRNQEILPLIHWTSETTGFCFSKNWGGVMQALKGSLVKSLFLEISPEMQLIYVFGTPKNIPLEGRVWWETTFKVLSSMKKMTSLYFYVNPPQRWYSGKFKDQENISQSIWALKRLEILRKLSLFHLNEAIQEYEVVQKTLALLPNINKLDLTIDNENAQIFNLQSLSGLKKLESLNIQGPSDLSALNTFLQNNKELHTLGIFGTWNPKRNARDKDLFSNEFEAPRIRELSLDAGIRVQTLEDKKIYLGFLNGFQNLQSLKIDFQWAKNLDFLNEYATALTSSKRLEALSIAISFTSLENMDLFFGKLHGLTSLKRLTIVSDIHFPKAIGRVLDDRIRSFQDFVLRQQSLESLELYWFKIGNLFLKKIEEMIHKLKPIKFLKISFAPPSQKYAVKAHHEMLDQISSIIKNTKCCKHIQLEIVLCYAVQRYLTWDIRRIQEGLRLMKDKTLSLQVNPFWNTLPFSFAWTI